MENWDSKKVLDKYIHDYMKKKNMQETAEIFAREADIDVDADVAIDAPEGFLKEWWYIFWDIFSSRHLQAEAGESSSQVAAATENVPQNFAPAMPRPPMSHQTTAGNMQLDPFASFPYPELFEQAMNAVQTPSPVLPIRPELMIQPNHPFAPFLGSELFQQAMSALQTPQAALNALQIKPQAALNAMQITPQAVFNAMQMPQVMSAMQTPQAMQTPWPKLPRSEMIQQAMNAMHTSHPILPRPDMIQQAMNAIQTPYAILPMPEMNQQIISGMYMSKLPDVSAIFPASLGFGLQQGEMPTLFAKTYEQEYLNRSSGNLTANVQPLEVEKMTQMLPTSSNASNQPQEISEKILHQQQQHNTEGIQGQKQQLPTDGKNLETSEAVVPISQEVPPDTAVLENEVSDAGGKSIQETAVQDHLLAGIGSFSPGTRGPVANSPVPVPSQQQQIPEFGGHYLQCHLPKTDAQNSGNVISSASGSSYKLPRPMLIDNDLSREALQLPGNAQIDGGVQQKAPGIQIAEETVIPEKQPIPKLKQHMSNEDGKNTEAGNTMNEDIQLQISGHPFSTFLQKSPAVDESAWKGFSFREFGSIQSSKNKLLCCHFTSMGRLLVGAGYQNKILICNTESSSADIIHGHSDAITDIRFRPNSTVFATSSFDKTLQIWDATKINAHPAKLVGHSDYVMSLDFHPRKGNLLCSCDGSNEMRIWDVTQQTCTRIYQGGSSRVRFQPRNGFFMASAMGNIINLIDVETSNIIYQLKGHVKDIRSLCWDTSGAYIASVSEDSARIWAINLAGQCIHELHCNGSNFESCTFHPRYSQLMIIGTCKKLEFWNPTLSNRTLSYSAHKGIIAALADSPYTETIASASHDSWLKLWK